MERYSQQIEPEATHATVPEEIHPVAAAFGGDIGKALENGGEKVASRLSVLSTHLARMNYYRGKAQEADIVNKYKEGLSTQVLGDPGDPNATVTYTPNADTKGLVITAGQLPSNTAPYSLEKPLGVYNWKDNDASGAIDYIDQWHHQAVDQAMQQAKNLGLRNVSSLTSELDKAWSSERNSIVAHEVKQINDAQIKTYMKGMQLDADNAVTKQDPISLGRTIESINQQSDTLTVSQHKSIDDPSNELTKNKFVGMALNNSINAMLRTSNDPMQAQATIDKLYEDGKINETVHINATEHIEKSFKVMTDQANRAVKIQMTNGRMNLINQVSQGKVNLSNQSAIDEIAQNDPKLAEAINENILNKGENIKENDATFADLTNKIYTSGSKEQISNFTMMALKANSNGELSQDRLNILVNAAMERGKHVADIDGDAQKKNPIQSMIDSGMKALFGWNKDQGKHDGQTYADYMTSIKNGKNVNESYHQAITNSIIRNNPSVSTMATPPNFVITKDSKIKAVFPRTNRKEENGSSSGTKE